MYYAKRSGKNLFKFHDDAVAQATRARLRMDNLLRSALEREELFLHYQPQMDLSTLKRQAQPISSNRRPHPCTCLNILTLLVARIKKGASLERNE